MSTMEEGQLVDHVVPAVAAGEAEQQPTTNSSVDDGNGNSVVSGAKERDDDDVSFLEDLVYGIDSFYAIVRPGKKCTTTNGWIVSKNKHY